LGRRAGGNLAQATTAEVRVYNAGRSGTNPKNYAGVYQEFFSSDPNVDLVIVGLCLSDDIIEESTPRERVSAPPTLATRVKFYALKYSVLYNLVRRSLRYNPRTEKVMAKLGLTNPRGVALEFRNSEANRCRWPYTADFLASFGATVEATGRRFLVVLIPSKEQILDEYIQMLMHHTGARPEDVDLFGFRDYVLRALQEKGVDVLDLSPVFQHPQSGAANFYFRGDGHWNAAGHQLAAMKIAEHLRQKPPQLSDLPSPPLRSESASRTERPPAT
jgi:SGNH hydrolase-like domain, acetyltransferase AlgX